MKDKWQEIELLAYHIWEREGRPEGRAEDHWEQALREWEALARRKTKAGTPQGKKARPRKTKAGAPQGKKARSRKSGRSSDEAGTPSPPAKPARQKKKPDGAKPAGRTTRRK